MNPVLELRSVNHSFGAIAALENVDLKISQGSFTAIFGRNGAGKSTLASVLAGVKRPTKGRVLVRGDERRVGRSFVHDGIALVPEGRRLFGQMSVEENIVLGALPLREHRATVRRRFGDVLANFPDQLRDRLSTPAAALSGGEQQMVALARALMADPAVVVLDEPSLGLAPVIVGELHRLLRELYSTGRTIVLVEQSATALRYASHALVLEHGRITHEGSADDPATRSAIESAYFGSDL